MYQLVNFQNLNRLSYLRDVDSTSWDE